MPRKFEGVFSDDTTVAAETVEVPLFSLGSATGTPNLGVLTVLTAAAMECGGAGEFHLFLAPDPDDSTPADVTSVLRTYTGSTAVASFNDTRYIARAVGDKLWIKYPIGVSIHVRAFTETA